MKQLFLSLTKFERTLWIISVTVVTAAFFVGKCEDVLTLIASLIGVTALVLVAKGLVAGQLLTVVFAVIYAVISFNLRYYGEMITYVCMSAPIALMSAVSWIKHPYRDENVVEVAVLGRKGRIMLITLTAAVTFIFYFILQALGNASLFVSTVSVATSFSASYLMLVRSPYYAVCYGANDIVLIVLWVIAALENPQYIPMILCFVMFLANDIYGFVNWNRMKKQQSAS